MDAHTEAARRTVTLLAEVRAIATLALRPGAPLRGAAYRRALAEAVAYEMLSAATTEQCARLGIHPPIGGSW